MKFCIFRAKINTREIFATALGLETAWYIGEVIFYKSSFELNGYTAFNEGLKFEFHDGMLRTAYDTALLI